MVVFRCSDKYHFACSISWSLGWYHGVWHKGSWKASSSCLERSWTPLVTALYAYSIERQNSRQEQFIRDSARPTRPISSPGKIVGVVLEYDSSFSAKHELHNPVLNIPIPWSALFDKLNCHETVRKLYIAWSSRPGRLIKAIIQVRREAQSQGLLFVSHKTMELDTKTCENWRDKECHLDCL